MITKQNYKQFDSTIKLYDCRPEIFLAMREYFHPISPGYVLQQYSRKHGFCLIPLFPSLDYNLFDRYDVNKVSIPGEWRYLPAFKSLDFKFDLGRSDYIYNIDELINPAGKKYTEYRRKLNLFKNVEYTVNEINKSNSNDVFKFLWDWEQEYINNPATYDEETDYDDACMMLEEIENWSKGIILYLNSTILGYVLGFEIDKNIFCAYSMKSNTNIDGSHRLIMYELAKKLKNSGHKEISFCDDGDDLGLRRLKESYKPTRFIERYYLSC